MLAKLKLDTWQLDTGQTDEKQTYMATENAWSMYITLLSRDLQVAYLDNLLLL